MQELRSDSDPSSADAALILPPHRQLERFEAFGSSAAQGTRYIVPAAWFKLWLDFCRGTGHDPGPINVSSIADAQGNLLYGLAENSDVLLFPEPTWRLLDAK